MPGRRRAGGRASGSSPSRDRPRRASGSSPSRERPSGVPLTARNRVRWVGLAAVAAASLGGVLLYLTSPAHTLHDPQHSLQQLDYFYLDEPAPALDELAVAPGTPGTPALLVFCDPLCDAPRVDGAQVVVSDDADLARRYALLTADGRVGPGYALVDGRGVLRYRSFDPGLHEREIQVLVDALR